MLPRTLAPNDAVDFQLHTIHSDGTWTAEALLDHLVEAAFALVAVTDHDRLDTVAAVQQLGATRGLPVVAAAELSSEWEGEMLDLLCYGFDPANPGPLGTLAAATRDEQMANLAETYATLQQQGYRFPEAARILAPRNGQVSRLEDLVALLTAHGYTNEIGAIIRGAGFRWITADPSAILDAAHRSGAVCLIAHPGRGEEFIRFDRERLDRFRAQVPVDGLEVHYPLHTAEQVALYRAYAEQHGLLISAGSDSHGSAGRLPIKNPASAVRVFLQRLGVQVSEG
jgi:predicted metal-dependent phosphoesterase TrpH